MLFFSSFIYLKSFYTLEIYCVWWIIISFLLRLFNFSMRFLTLHEANVDFLVCYNLGGLSKTKIRICHVSFMFWKVEKLNSLFVANLE